MDEESKYRVEDPDKRKDEAVKAFLTPLPETATKKKPRTVPMVRFFGKEIKETTRDWIVLFMMPLFAGIFDASIYASVIVDLLIADVLYFFILPALIAIPVGLVIPQASRALLGGLLCVLFFVVFLLIFFMSPGFFAPDLSPFDYMFTSGVFLAIYSLFIILASLLGTLFGIIVREFF